MSTDRVYCFNRRRMLLASVGLFMPFPNFNQDPVDTIHSIIEAECNRQKAIVFWENGLDLSPSQSVLSSEILIKLAGETNQERWKIIANAIDCDCIFISEQHIVFKQRFNQKDLFPEISLEEACFRLEKAVAKFQQLSGLSVSIDDNDTNNPVFEFARSVSEDDKKRLREGIFLSDYPELKTFIIKSVCCHLSKSFSLLLRVKKCLQVYQQKESRFKRVRLVPSAPEITVLEGYFSKRRLCQLALSHTFTIDSQGFAVANVPDNGGLLVRYGFTEMSSPSRGLEIGKLLNRLPDTPLPNNLRRQNTVNVHKITEIFPSYRFMHGLEERHITVIGAVDSSDVQTAKAICRLLDCQYEVKEGKFVFSPSTLQRIRSIADLFNQVHQILPAPFVRYFNHRFDAEVAKKLTGEPQNNRMNPSQVFALRSVILRDFRPKIYQETVTALRCLIQDKVEGDKYLQTIDADFFVDSLTAQLFLIEAISEMYYQTRYFTDFTWLERLDKLVVKCDISGSENNTISLGILEADRKTSLFAFATSRGL